MVASSVSAYACCARSRTVSMCASIDEASGWICTTVTSSPASLAYSLNAISRGSLASMNSTSPGTRLRSRSSCPALSRLVAMKMNGECMAPFCVGWLPRSCIGFRGAVAPASCSARWLVAEERIDVGGELAVVLEENAVGRVRVDLDPRVREEPGQKVRVARRAQRVAVAVGNQD